MKEQKYDVIFSGLKNLISEKIFSHKVCWVDEFCSFALMDTDYVSKLMDAAESVILVTCFEIPKFHIFDHPKVKVIQIPPHSKVASICASPFGNAILPDVLPEIENEVRKLATPGSLLLVSAGFAGKVLIDIGKKAGAVAIDFGAALDDMLGWKTRSTELHAQFSQPMREELCIYQGGKIKRKDMKTKVLIKLEDPRKLPDVNWRSYYAGNRQRFSLATGVKFVDPQTVVCNSLLARKMYLFRFDFNTGWYHTLDGITTTFKDRTTETDLLDLDERGNIFTSNCGNGSLAQYRYDNHKITFVKDIPLYDKSFIHGVKYFRSNIVAASIISEPLGVHFVDVDTLQVPLHIKTDIKAKDMCFLSDNQLVILTTYGKLTTETDEGYDSEIQLINFDFANKSYNVIEKKIFKNCHFDCVVFHEGILYINEQFKDCLYLVDPKTLEQIGIVSGYDFPHGIDIKHGMIAVTNYGSNSIDIRSI